MRYKVVIITLLFCSVVYASAVINSQTELLCIQGFSVPASDVVITDDFARAMLAGFYWPDGDDASGYEAHRRELWFRHHHH